MSSDKSSETYCWFDELFITNSPVINHTPIKRSTGSFDVIWINYVNVYTKSSQLRSCLSPSKNLTLCRAEQDVACTQSPQECAVIAWPLCLRSAPQRACSRVATNQLLIHHLMWAPFCRCAMQCIQHIYVYCHQKDSSKFIKNVCRKQER